MNKEELARDPDQSPPWLEGTDVVEVTIPPGERLPRFWSDKSGNESGQWFATGDQVQGRSVNELRDDFALSTIWNDMDRVSVGTTTRPTRVQIGRAAPQRGANGIEHPGGAIQIRVLDDPADIMQFETIY